MDKNFKDLFANLTRDTKDHLFWNTQPVPQNIHQQTGNSEIESDPPFSNSEHTSINLPSSLSWSEINIADPVQIHELHSLLYENYVEDIESKFRFNYSIEFLKWALLAPGWKQEWILGIRNADHTLVGFISAIPTLIRIHTALRKSVAINFLCIHKHHRSQRLSPLLITEITSRVHHYGKIFQAVYTTGTFLPQPLSTPQYFHRPLNYPKLVETKFSSCPPHLLPTKIKEYYIDPALSTLSLREMQYTDCSSVLVLLNEYLSRFAFSTIFESEEEIKHWFISKPNVIYSYIHKDPHGTVLGFVSFYELPTHILDESHPDLRVAYLYYYAVKAPNDLCLLIAAVLVKIKAMGFDVLNCLNIMDNALFLDKLKFVMGDGHLHYYMFNWKTTPLDPSQIGIVML